MRNREGEGGRERGENGKIVEKEEMVKGIQRKRKGNRGREEKRKKEKRGRGG